MQIVRLFRKILNVFDNKKKKHNIVPWGILPLPKRSETGLKLGIAPESFNTLRKIKKQQKIKISISNNLSLLSDEQREEISRKVIRDVAAMKLVSGTRGLSGKELEAYYERVGANKTKLSEQQRKYFHKVFSDAFKKALKEL